METENDTAREVEYEQTGEGGGGFETGPGQSRGKGEPEPCVPRQGLLGPREGDSFTPKCRPPWRVKFTRGSELLGTSRPIQAHEANAKVRLDSEGNVTVTT